MIFLANILLALAWLALTGQYTLVNFAIGFGLGAALLWVDRRVMPSKPYFNRVTGIIGFVFFFLWQLVLANLRVMYDILSPNQKMRPAIVDIPLDIREPGQITLLANLITLTPGTLSLDVSDDGRTLYVHSMHTADAETVRRDIKDGFERYIREVFG